MRPEERSILKSFIPGVLLAALMWLVKGYEMYLNTSFFDYGIYPRSIEALKGIITMPFIHDDLNHIISNSVPLIILIAAMVYFYRPIAVKVIIWVWLLDGMWLWLGGRPSWHIGASGVVYGLASFLFFSGVFRKHINLMALSLLIVFLYGGLIWGVLPLMQGMSWEAHLFGVAAGLLLSYVYREEGPQRKVYDWELEDEKDDIEVEEKDEEEHPAIYIVHYDYKEKKDENGKEN